MEKDLLKNEQNESRNVTNLNKELVEGVFLSNERGFAFVKVEGQASDIYISRKYKRDAMNNDIVLVKILNSKHGNNLEGQVVKVIQRSNKTVVGTFQKSKNFGFVIPDDNKISGDIFISKSNWKKAKNNQKVVVELTKYPDKNKKAEGKITEILGFADETGVDMLSIIKQFNLPYEFPNNVEEEAKLVSQEKVSLKNRKDLRELEIFTVDGEDAKDLDDAINVEKNIDGTYTLGVHIADVSNYVREGSMLNAEAVIRGTSVYMLDRVIPMLPKELSNGACSLNQKEDRYAISVIMKINKEGKVIDSDIFKSVIKVTKRMNYHDVTTIINRNENLVNNSVNTNKKLDKNNTKKVLQDNEPYFEHFDRMRELAEILKNRRIKDGYLSLDIPESKITLDTNGVPIKIEEYETTIANEIIEQCMLTANETVAETFYWLNAPFIYRVHEKPEEEKIVELNKYLYNFGYKLKGKKDDIKPRAFEQILDDVKGKEEERVVANLLLRTLKIAKYSEINKGHFGIASKYYCHFTSPIRRYPDLFIHRIISKYLESNYNMGDTFKEKYFIQAVKYSQTSSDTEQIATKAERESEALKKAEYMENHIGEEFEGIVSSITNFGMFVELENTVEGLVRFENMGKDYYEYNEANKTLIGRKNKKIYKLGSKVLIQVLDSNKQTRKIDFKLIK